jgi:hypothetical protein
MCPFRFIPDCICPFEVAWYCKLISVLLFISCHILDYRKLRTPTPESTVLHVGCLTRNVNEAHLKEIFGAYSDFRSIGILRS